ncbi:MAG: hypothetical protein WBQ81_06085 [Candidatus Sulfotelmatobacter sp.]
MRHSRFISSTPLTAGLLTGLMFAILVVPLNADDSDSRYDVSKEVTLTGTVSSVLRKPAPGMIWGSHLIVETVSGRLDASLGRFGLEGKGALSVTLGQQIELTGVMKTVRDKEVFEVRSVKANGKTHTMRNEHGIEVSPQARERAAEKGVTL